MDGKRIHLYELENWIIRKEFSDARIHAAINCASAACPKLDGTAFTVDNLDTQLDRVTTTFCSSAPHVRIDHANRKIWLSQIFEWFQEDFETHMKSMGQEEQVLTFVMHYAM